MSSETANGHKNETNGTNGVLKNGNGVAKDEKDIPEENDEEWDYYR